MDSLNFFGMLIGLGIGFGLGIITMYIAYLIIYRDIQV